MRRVRLSHGGISRFSIARVLSFLAVLLLPALLSAQTPGTEDRTIEVGGTRREYLLHIPPGFKKSDQAPAPLVVMLHGRTSSGKAASGGYYGWTRLADKEGFVAVFPTALGNPTSWQAGFGGRATEDTRFLTQLIDTLIKELALDKQRVFMTGHSSGAFMSYSFAALHADKVAAIGPVAGLNIARMQAGLPVSVISFHGMADKVVAYDADHGKAATFRGMPSAVESASAFASRNGCAAKPDRAVLNDGKVLLDTWPGGKAGTQVELYSLEGWGHGWPKGESKVSATELIWKFFHEHARKPE